MIERVAVRNRILGGGNYFSSPKSHREFIKSGSKVLDLALGGGWAKDRISNIVGNRSSGKTLLAIEAAANFSIQYPRGEIFYRESESAFDKEYAGALGMPIDKIQFGEEPLHTVEDFFDELTAIINKARKYPTLYILDSLDALSDRAELEREIDKGSFGAAKAKKMSELFRRLTSSMAATQVTLLIISQIRDKIGVMYGNPQGRTGGRSLDFYASQVLWLAQLQILTRQAKGVKRAIGIQVRAKVDKNKVALPYREAEFPVIFGYGIDDVAACLDWGEEVKALELVTGGLSRADYERAFNKAEDRAEELMQLHQRVEDHWYAIEKDFLPTEQKYVRPKHVRVPA